MFFEDKSQVLPLAKSCGFSIFVLPETVTKNLSFPAKNSIEITPDKNNKISVDAIREIIDICKVEQKNDFFIVIREAEKINEQAENAFLKLLEEPAENYHFVLIVKNASTLLKTILSRGNLYILRSKNQLSSPITEAPEEFKSLAKRLISAKPSELPGLADEITKNAKVKKDARKNVLLIIDLAIEILYKSYFKTENIAFIKKLPNLLALEENIRANGHIKLHIVADLC